jgi:hypothetical protein
VLSRSALHPQTNVYGPSFCQWVNLLPLLIRRHSPKTCGFHHRRSLFLRLQSRLPILCHQRAWAGEVQIGVRDPNDDEDEEDGGDEDDDREPAAIGEPDEE